jgi:DNA modification methylase
MPKKLDDIGSPSGGRSRRSPPRANDLDGTTWIKYSLSVWGDLAKTHDEQAYKHPAMFPSALPDRLIQMFTTADARHTVLDPFMGSGSTLVAAVNNGKRGIGFELYDEFIRVAQARLTAELNFSGCEPDFKIIKDDARNLDKYLGARSVDLCITSPPYWDIHHQKRTADQKEARPYGSFDKDLGMITSYESFLSSLSEVFAKVFVVLKPGSYCIVNVMDLRKQSRFYAFHIDVIEFMQQIGFELDDLIIWDRAHEYNNLRPLGFPSVFRINKVHEFILIFKAPDEKGSSS